MEAIILVGVQASGKSTFCLGRFYDTHIRINLDMLRTRSREQILLDACLKGKQPFVVDNTNPTKEARARYITPAKANGFKVVGFYFSSKVEECKQRNEQREQPISLLALLGTYNKLQLPERTEGFDDLYYVTITENGKFLIDEWNDEV